MNRKTDWTIGQLARFGRVTTRTLRLYDEIGLLCPRSRSQAGYRLYEPLDLEKLRQITALQGLGFSLDEVKAHLGHLHRSTRPFLEANRATMQHRLDHQARVLGLLATILEQLPQPTSSFHDLFLLQEQLDPPEVIMQTTSQAVAALHVQLREDNQEKFVPLVQEEHILASLPVAVASYRGLIKILPNSPAQTEKYLTITIEPLLERMQSGEWPEEARLESFYELNLDGVTYNGLGLGIEFRTPGALFPGFSLPVLDVWYGRFSYEV